MTRPRPWPSVLAASILLAATSLLSACAEPDLPEGEADDAEAPDDGQAPDPAAEQLRVEVAALEATITAAADALSEVAETTPVDEARQAGRLAVASLVDDPGLAGGQRPEQRPLFPARSDDRGAGGGEAEDALSAVSTAARGASGAQAELVADVLRDPIAGDLGAWSRDPAGMVALVETTIAVEGELAALEQAVLELPGEGTRALAWALLTAEAPDAEAAAAYAERGLAHLSVIQASLRAIDADPSAEPSSEPSADPPADPDGAAP